MILMRYQFSSSSSSSVIILLVGMLSLAMLIQSVQVVHGGSIPWYNTPYHHVVVLNDGTTPSRTSRLGVRLSPASNRERLKRRKTSLPSSPSPLPPSFSTTTATNTATTEHQTVSMGLAQKAKEEEEEMPSPSQQQLLQSQSQQQPNKDQLRINILTVRHLYHPFQKVWKRISQNNNFIGRILSYIKKNASILQFAILCYLGYECLHAIWDIITTEEFQKLGLFDDDNNDYNNNGLDGTTFWGSGRSRLISPLAASQLVVWLYHHQDHHQEEVVQQSNTSSGSSTRRGRLPPLPCSVSPLALHLARQLQASGVPLLSSNTMTTTSVESILVQLTRRQAELLQSCLVVPNPSLSLQHSVSGLHGVKQALRQWIHQQRKYNHHLWKQQRQDGGGGRKNSDNTDDNEEAMVVLNPLEAFVHASSPGTQHSRTTMNSSSSSSTPRQLQGMLLYGPPGCGKSLLIQTISCEAQLPTLVVTPSLLQSKWYGDATRQVRTLFQVLDIVRPCILVLDELDGLFRERQSSDGNDSDVSRELKTEFLQWWDGVLHNHYHPNRHHNNNNYHSSAVSGSKSQDEENEETKKVHDDGGGGGGRQLAANKMILVIGATNRPFDVDSAVLRRLPQSYWIGLPTLDDRREMVWKWARDYGLLPYIRDGSSSTSSSTTNKDDSATASAFHKEEPHPSSSMSVLETLAQATTHYTPSDLWQVLQTACLLGPVARGDSQLTSNDIWNALPYVPPTHLNPRYIQQLYQFGSRSSPPSPQAAAAAAAASSSSHTVAPDVWTRVPSDGDSEGDDIDDQGVWKWETSLGNFYHLGHVPMDIHAMQDLLQVLEYLGSNDYNQEYEDDYDDSLYDFDDDDDDWLEDDDGDDDDDEL